MPLVCAKFVGPTRPKRRRWTAQKGTNSGNRVSTVPPEGAVDIAATDKRVIESPSGIRSGSCFCDGGRARSPKAAGSLTLWPGL